MNFTTNSYFLLCNKVSAKKQNTKLFDSFCNMNLNLSCNIWSTTVNLIKGGAKERKIIKLTKIQINMGEVGEAL